MNFGRYSKLYVAIGAAVVSFVNSLYGVQSPIATLVIGIIGAIGVFAVTNTTDSTANLG